MKVFISIHAFADNCSIHVHFFLLHWNTSHLMCPLLANLPTDNKGHATEIQENIPQTGEIKRCQVLSTNFLYPSGNWLVITLLFWFVRLWRKKRKCPVMLQDLILLMLDSGGACLYTWSPSSCSWSTLIGKDTAAKLRI